ncbi:18368_t:CDS:2 [Gigaspora margarita]|uniref:18368_t:CDS:1 n=1 Tax=Gigaspora margarita TaxID=4874 RepID=A0ABN7VT35_GIGMA|nr:18368_t:CDS:2 [Gigaspora margarita]
MFTKNNLEVFFEDDIIFPGGLSPISTTPLNLSTTSINPAILGSLTPDFNNFNDSNMSNCSLWFSPIYPPFIYPNNDAIPVPSPASPLKCNDTCIKHLNNLVIKIPDAESIKLSTNIYPFNKGKAVFIEFSIRIRSTYNNIFMKGLGLEPENKTSFIDAEIKEFQVTNSQDTYLILKPKTLYNEKQTFNYTTLFIISSLGGFYGAVSGIYILLFGNPKLSPRGLIHKYMCCFDIRKKLEITTAKHYVSKAGIPFADNPCDFTLNERILVLESVLRKYYLDTDYFAELNYVIQQNKIFKRDNNLQRKDDSVIM